MMTTGKAIHATHLVHSLATFIVCVAVCGCGSRAANPTPDSESPQQAGASATGAARSSAASTNKAPAKAAPMTKIKFRAYDVIDQKLGGMAANRLAIPDD